MNKTYNSVSLGGTMVQLVSNGCTIEVFFIYNCIFYVYFFKYVCNIKSQLLSTLCLHNV